MIIHDINIDRYLIYEIAIAYDLPLSMAERLLGRLHGLPELAELRGIKKRRAAYIKRLVEPAWRGQWDSDEWKNFTLSDPEARRVIELYMYIRVIELITIYI